MDVIVNDQFLGSILRTDVLHAERAAILRIGSRNIVNVGPLRTDVLHAERAAILRNGSRNIVNVGPSLCLRDCLSLWALKVIQTANQGQIHKSLLSSSIDSLPRGSTGFGRPSDFDNSSGNDFNDGLLNRHRSIH